MVPSVGRIVHYTLTAADAGNVALSRVAAGDGDTHYSGDVCSMMIVRVWPDNKVNGQVFLDGNDTLWVTSIEEGPDERQWHAPPRV